MSGARIIDLPPGAALTGPEPFETVQGGVSVQVSATQMAAYVGAITQLRGDVTTPLGGGSQFATLATVNANTGTFQGLTLDGKGRVTAATNMNYAPLASPAFTGTPTAPTATAGTNTTQIATTAYVQASIGASGGGTITGVAAGTGLTGGGITGSVTLALVAPVTIALGGTNATTAAAALANLGGAPLASPAFTGVPTAPTPASNDNSTTLATTAYVRAQGFVTGGPYAPLASPAFTGVPTAPTPASNDNSTTLATTAYVQAQGFVSGGPYAPLASPLFTGTPAAPTAAPGTANTQIATTGFVAASFALLASPAFTGVPTAPTPATATNSTQVATTAFVKAQAYVTGPAGTTGQIQFNNAGAFGAADWTISNGLIQGNNATSNFIAWPGLGFAPPSFTARSAGTRLVLNPTLSGTAADIAIGSQATTLWLGVSTAAGTFSWYGGTTQLAYFQGYTFRINATTAAIALPGVSVPGFQLAAADNNFPTFQGDTWGTGACYFIGRQAGGTGAAPSATVSGQAIVNFVARGYDTAYLTVDSARITMTASETFSASGHGARIGFSTTQIGSTTLTENVRIENDGGLCLPGTIGTGSQGRGTINVSGGYYVGGAGPALVNSNWAFTGSSLAANQSGSPAPNLLVNGPYLQLIGGAAGQTGMQINTFASYPSWVGARADGTPSAPAAIAGVENMMLFRAYGYNGASYVEGARISFSSSAAWSGSANGAYIDLATTASGSTTLTSNMRLQNDGGLCLPGGIATGSQGSGTINVSGGYYVGGAGPALVNSNWGFGGSGGNQLIANLSGSAAPPNVVSGPYLQLVAAATVALGIQANAFASYPSFVGVRADGTPSAPAAIAGVENLMLLRAYGYNGASYVEGARINFISSAAWTGSANGAFIDFSTTPSASVTIVNNMRLNNDGGLALPSNQTSQGSGTINVSGGYYVGATNIITGGATAQASPTNPTGTSSTTAVMMGLAGAITPRLSGRVFVMISGAMSNSVAGDGGLVQLRYGTGTAPTNGAATTGTPAGNFVNLLQAATGDRVQWTLAAVLTGLTSGTAYWLDVALNAVTGGTVTLINVNVSAFEI